LNLKKYLLNLVEDADRRILFDVQYPLFVCTDLIIGIDIKYFGWKNKDDE